MSKKQFSEEALRDIAAKKVSYRYSVKIHFSIYILVNILLFIINFFTSGMYLDFTRLWSLYPLLGWGIGVAMHCTAYLMYANGVYPMAKRGVIFHIVAYLLVILLLAVTNLMTAPAFLWVIYPAIFWGAGLIAHIIVYIIYFRSKITPDGEAKSKKERQIEKEMEKMKKKMK
ncbi:MAG: 2TM domain-containing protein [Promethearchaeota archaeon]